MRVNTQWKIDDIRECSRAVRLQYAIVGTSGFSPNLIVHPIFSIKEFRNSSQRPIGGSPPAVRQGEELSRLHTISPAHNSEC